jgi:hypothetical protein
MIAAIRPEMDGILRAMHPDIDTIDHLVAAIRAGRWIVFRIAGDTHYNHFRAQSCEIDVQYPRLVSNGRLGIRRTGELSRLEVKLHNLEIGMNVQFPDGGFDISTFFQYGSELTTYESVVRNDDNSPGVGGKSGSTGREPMISRTPAPSSPIGANGRDMEEVAR